MSFENQIWYKKLGSQIFSLGKYILSLDVIVEMHSIHKVFIVHTIVIDWDIYEQYEFLISVKIPPHA